MAKKTNKTSHVMNLLTNGSEELPASPAPGQNKALSQKITVVDEADTNKRVSTQIASELSKELSKDTALQDPPKAPEGSFQPSSSAEEEDPICFVNVMEELVRKHNTQKMMEEYNVCTCKRCQADVRALALSNLPPKYIVTERASLPLLLSYYESRYRIPIFTQLVKACIEVHDHPRHNNPAA